MKNAKLLILVLLIFGFWNANAQSSSGKLLTLKGTITDVRKEPVIDAAVLVKGTKQGTISDLDGKFELKGVKAGSTLEISCIGFAHKQVVWNGGELNIVLADDKNLLNEVVVVGLGTQSRKTITSAVSTVKADAIQNRPITNVTSALQGNVSGLNFSTEASENSTSGGEPGAEISFNIRGIGSINGGGPYILVDGIEQSLQNVNPADIESISILKDASASAIYGSRAAYGVVLVTTKSGKKNSFHISYNGNVGASSPINMPQMMNSLEYAQYKNIYNQLNGLNPAFTDDQIEKIKGFLNAPYSQDFPGIDVSQDGTSYLAGRQYGNTDWFRYHFKRFSLRHDHNLSISGGSDNTKYYVGLGFNNQQGLLNGVKDDLKKISVNTKASIDLSKQFSIEFNNNITFMDIDRPLPDMTIVYHNISRSEPNRVTTLPINNAYNIPTWNNNLGIRSVFYNEQRISDALSMGFTFKPINGVSIIGQINGRFNFNKNNLNKSQPYVSRPDGILVPMTGATQGYGPRGFHYSVFPWNSYARSNSNEYYLSPNIYASYEKNINRHNLKVLAGYQMEYDYSDNISAYKTGLLTDNIFSFLNASGNGDFRGGKDHWATSGFYAKFNYNYNDTYFLEISGRYDGSSRFARDYRWGLFPSASFGVDFANLSWFKDLETPVNQLKLRLSYGRLGNQNGVGLYQYQSKINLVSNPANGWLLPGLGAPEVGIIASTPNLASTTLTWEKVDMGNIGIDFAAFKERLNVNLDIYQRDTRDMIGPAEIIPDVGGIPDSSRPKLNNANLRTRGFELSINWSDQFKSGFRYSIGGNISDYRSIITKYNNPDGVIKNNHTGLIRNRGYYEGMDIGEIWGYEANNLFQSNAEIDEYLTNTDISFFTSNTSLLRAGDLRYIDTNGDGRISPGKGTLNDHGDLKIIGNATPRYSFGINLSFGYKGFEISSLWQGVGKRQFPIAGSTYMFSGNENFFKEHLDFFRENNTNAFLPRPTLTDDAIYKMNTGYNTTRYLLDASYIRLKNLTISYTFNKDLLSKIYMSNLKLYLSIDNLFTFDKLPNAFDPETLNQINTWAGGSNENAPGLTSPMNRNGNGKVYPLSRNFVFGINITF